jgi:glutamyl-tRNA reductase
MKGRVAAAAEAEKIVVAEAQGFRQRLAGERAVPTIVALRNRLEETCQEELERYRKDFGPVTSSEEQALKVLTVRIVHRLSGTLARELKTNGNAEQQELATAVQKLFRLRANNNEELPRAAAGARN